MHPVSRQHLYDPDPCKDTSRKRIERSDSNEGAGVTAVEVIENANTNGHTNGRDERKDTGHDELVQSASCGFGQLRDASSKCDSFEHLVEKDNNEEGDEECITSYNERDTND